MLSNTTPYSEGNPKKAKIVFIGEAPSSMELVANRPFVGPAGKVLDRCLHAAGISRADCYITNIFSEPLRKSKDVLPKDMMDCSEDDYFRLIEVFEQLREDAIIVPLGNTALNLMCGQTEITKYRGTPTPCTFERFNHSVIPTIHPAATLRGQFLWQYFIISDLKKVKRWSQGKGGLPVRDYRIGPSAEESIEWLKRMCEVDQYAWDIEIWNNQISCLSFAPSQWECMSIPLVDAHQPGKQYFKPSEEVEVWRWINKALYTENTKIGQNLMFDASWMFHFHNCLMRGEVKDTMIAHHIMYPDFPKGLDFLSSIYTDEPYYKEDRKLWKTLGVDQPRFWLYNAKDSAITYAVWDALEEEVKRDYQETYDMTLRLFYPLLYMIERGVTIDKERLATTRVRIQEEIRKKRIELSSVAEWDFNPASPKQCQEYFYITKGIKPYTNRSTGKISCDDKALQRLATTHQLREASLVQEIRYFEKLHGTYLAVEFDPDGRLRCFWNSRGTSTGRLSSSKTLWGSGLNFQNLHPVFQEFIVADEV